MTELCRAGLRFVTLRTGWLRSPFMRLVLPPRSALDKQSRCQINRQQKPLTKLVASKARFLSAGHMGKQWACVPEFGRRSGASGTQKAQPPALKRSPAQDGARKI